MEITRIAPRKIYEEIADQIKQQIVSGRLQPGQKLPSTRELTESYQVGRSTMREALSMLKAMGLIEIRQGEGCYVRAMDDRELELPQFEHLFTSIEAVFELLEARKALEMANAGMAAAKRTTADLEELERILADMDSELGTEAVGEKQDMRFHLALSTATHNPIMVKLLETISAQVEVTIRESRRLQLYRDKQMTRRFWQEHKAIYEAIRDRDVARAQAEMEAHLLYVERQIREYMEKKAREKAQGKA
ncbi:FadR/GntR family transcriptional regulator [Paenibacillus koleovorans]|uniref:FadR/GntR family transcriptional regulator n=1 Tax=Paenibacillus koleovorans TaxID=121608 RepID=UPI000FD9D0E1|nr:FadR/GntR family transcriptional regulator [Paenibacillus koleovorans]